MVPNFFNEDWRFWQIINPKDGLAGTMIGLAVLAVLIHLALLFGSEGIAKAWMG
ncbi:light-harvesting antenna LH1, alpha subunit [Roseospira visakhapatnamensis]|uniref:Putative secreted protein n=1 Tax=Roseospira visakhapatnamensis TaxID=390880 RepID=A0A7W6RBQ4_9PROT|nr:light-harvesting antenna LH1, alpha subunit [Roseospira visakhapatnamensis]MBB4265554.1 putative secreted protein [Roseospira visakhapatnamensis]